MNLEYEFTYNATLKDPVQIGPGPYGTRLVFEVTGGSLDGKRLKGKVLTGGADWVLVGPDGWGRLDVRIQFLTDDGAAIYTVYSGLLDMNEKVQRALTAGSGTDYGDQYFRTSPRFETGDPRYGWLNHTLFVAEGRMVPHAVEYKVYRVT
ncbi:MAG TPA: DUF3237 domain-containing protein [Myxococcota bacterium]|nr:DUF3237 domain-containing protein [Myxococcota bacterium]